MEIEKNRDIFWIRGQQTTVHGPKLALASANEVSLEHSHACSSLYCLLLTLCSRALWNSGGRDHRAAKSLTVRLLTAEVHRPLFWRESLYDL